MGRKKGGHYQLLRTRDDQTVEKFCRGPLHRGGEGGGTWVSVDAFGVNKSGRRAGRLRSHCRRCDSYRLLGREAAWVPVSAIRFAVDELVFRLGVMETARRLFKSQQWLWQFRKGRIDHVRHDTAVDIVTLLAEVRERGEVRSRRSIHHGATMRGRVDSAPSNRKDYWRITGDADVEKRREFRQRTGR